MAFKIEERFEVQAPVERVWKYLIDPKRVVECLPGAELLEQQDERTFLGAIKVKVGPLSMSYKGQAKFTEINEQTHQVRMVGDAREVGGSGSTKVSMLSTVAPLASGGSEVLVNADIDLVGKIVQFGRGMIEEVSRQMFRQFSVCVRQQLEVGDEPQATNKPAEAEAKAVAAAPLALLAEGLKQNTHHRPLGAATFAVLALGIIVSMMLVAWRLMVFSASGATTGRRAVFWLMVAGALGSVGFVLFRALGAPALVPHVLDGLRALATATLCHLLLRY